MAARAAAAVVGGGGSAAAAFPCGWRIDTGKLFKNCVDFTTLRGQAHLIIITRTAPLRFKRRGQAIGIQRKRTLLWCKGGLKGGVLVSKSFLACVRLLPPVRLSKINSLNTTTSQKLHKKQYTHYIRRPHKKPRSISMIR